MKISDDTPLATYHLALLSKNDKEAFLWYKKGADMGHLNSYCVTGFSYAEGLGTTQDIKKGMQIIKECADKYNDSLAQLEMGKWYFEGEIVAKDLDKALEYSQKSAEQGVMGGILIYAAALMQKNDYDEALPWMLLANKYGASVDIEPIKESFSKEDYAAAEEKFKELDGKIVMDKRFIRN
ncbi:TPR repeat protein [Elusimicrobium posterum]|uniref:tetratricopeptide repeat protein n=1 Tax=Elusimicrobium posterum TaxID=3116653 RepID=UPI003C74C68F